MIRRALLMKLLKRKDRKIEELEEKVKSLETKNKQLDAEVEGLRDSNRYMSRHLQYGGIDIDRVRKLEEKLKQFELKAYRGDYHELEPMESFEARTDFSLMAKQSYVRDGHWDRFKEHMEKNVNISMGEKLFPYLFEHQDEYIAIRVHKELIEPKDEYITEQERNFYQFLASNDKGEFRVSVSLYKADKSMLKHYYEDRRPVAFDPVTSAPREFPRGVNPEYREAPEWARRPRFKNFED